jgi:catechol-2,3-dioxygenase
MLANQPIDVMLLATDLDAAKRFYGDQIGLEVLIETDYFVTFRCGGDSRLVVTKSETGTSEEQTKASWRVSDLASEVAALRARDVEVLDYDEPGLKTVDGIADVGFALSAWVVDPSGNTIGMLQFKDQEWG